MKVKSKIIIVVISLFVGLLHIIIPKDYAGLLSNFVNWYLIDILLPMDVYLLFQIALRQNFTVNKSRVLGAAFTLIIGITVEFSQFLGYSFLGRVFDPMDILMYSIGVLFGFLIDKIVISPIEQN